MSQTASGITLYKGLTQFVSRELRNANNNSNHRSKKKKYINSSAVWTQNDIIRQQDNDLKVHQ